MINNVAVGPSAPIASLIVSTDAPQLRFLIVDDTEDIRDLMARMVVRQGHAADEAADGVEAVAALQEKSYDFVLLDLSMPRMSGEDVVRWLNEHPEHAVGLRVVVITAWAGERRAVLQELGVTRVLQKPLRTQQLRDLISEADPNYHP
jgi:CheY-like chemotaxis protein